MTKKENIEKEVKNVKAKVAEVKEKDALDLAVDTMELEKKVEKKAKAVKAKVAEREGKDREEGGSVHPVPDGRRDHPGRDPCQGRQCR